MGRKRDKENPRPNYVSVSTISPSPRRPVALSPMPPWLIPLFTRQSRLRAQQAAERDLFYFICDFLASQSAVRPVPSRKPEQHPEQAEGRHCGVDVFQLTFVFQLPQRVSHQVEVDALALLNFAAVCGSQSSHFVIEHRERAVSFGGAPFDDQQGVIAK